MCGHWCPRFGLQVTPPPPLGFKARVGSLISGGSRISPRRGRQLSRGRQHTILPNFPKNCMKLKEFGPGGSGCVPRTPLRSVNAHSHLVEVYMLQQFHLWCYTCWALGSRIDLFHIPLTRHWWSSKRGSIVLPLSHSEDQADVLPTKLCRTYISFITGCNEVVAKVMFLLVSVILLTRGGLPQCMLGYQPPGSMHPLQKQAPSRKHAHPPFPRHTVNERRYACYWNAFLWEGFFCCYEIFTS